MDEEYKVLLDIYEEAQKKFINEKIIDNEKYILCLEKTQKLIKELDNFNHFEMHRNKELFTKVYLISADLLVRTVGLDTSRKTITDHQKNILKVAVTHLRKVLDVDPLNENACELFKLIFIYMSIYNHDINENLIFLQQVLPVNPSDYQLQYNLGFVQSRLNNLDESLKHYKCSLGVIDILIKSNNDDNIIKGLNDFKIKILNGIGTLYSSVQNRELALYYFEKAYEINDKDPDILNQLGVIHTEIRNTEKAVYYYMKGIKNIEYASNQIDKEMLLASMYMNMGLVKCYECDFEGAIDGYNQALKYKPKLSLAYQNKLLDLNYISHLIEDPMYIAKLHKNINKIYDNVVSDYRISCKNYKIKTENEKLNIGFISGDFICHPVSYFISNILKYINSDKFNVFCFSLKIINVENMYPKVNWHIVKNKDTKQLFDIIQSCNIDIMFDLSGHTGDNRLDTLALKPAPIQISYCGYPNSSGIRSIDYRITDRFCDSDKSQKYYVEKFIYLNKCFLNYKPALSFEDLPELKEQPYIKNGYITFGSFNRYNKINTEVVKVWETILKKIPNAILKMKTKEFTNEKVKNKFYDDFSDKEILKRVHIIEYKDTYPDHLSTYNEVDVLLDTFPYCGTTTSCESLVMGVPILTLFDSVRFYHSQNVTTSLLKNSKLKDFVAYTKDEYVNKAMNIHNLINADTKRNVRDLFINGDVCKYEEFINDFENKLIYTYKNHKWN